MTRIERIRPILDGIASISMTAAAIMVIWIILSGRVVVPATDGGGIPDAAENIERMGLTVRLNEATTRPRTATLVLVEFSDFECPFCGQYALKTFPRVKREFVDTGKVAYSFMHFPLENIHPRAVGAAGGAACAQQQGRFWEMHDLLFRNQNSPAISDLAGFARRLELNLSDFEQCIGRIEPQIRKDAAEAKRLGVTSTPTFLVGDLSPDGAVTARRRITGARPFETFKATIEELLDSGQRKS